ncbi:IclR family transcriptional regulator, partial [Microbacterium sp.]|uniref:IclR family transcriptional regulator n=1 Tax=Microbacterium sp. TaxID=51671 RepID=UPI00273257AD
MPTSVLGRALTIVTAFNLEDDELSLSSISRRTGIPKPTVHRLVSELADWRIVEKTDAGVRLGLQLFELGQMASGQRSLRETAAPFLRDLHEATLLTVHLGVLDGRQVVYLDKIPAKHGPQLASRVGGRMPLHCTAIGKALLAFADPELIASVLGNPLERLTPRSVIGPGLLEQQLLRIRTTRVSFEGEESTRGVVCVASPVICTCGVV